MKWLPSLSGLLLAAILLVPEPVQAVPVLWTLSGGTFEDGGALSGFFIFDVDTQIASDWSLAVSGGNTANFPPVTYTPSNSDFGLGGTIAGHQIYEFDIGNDRFLFFPFDPDLSNAGGLTGIFVSPGNAGELRFVGATSFFRDITAGTANGVPVNIVPMPGSLVLLGTGLLGFIGFFWRRRPA